MSESTVFSRDNRPTHIRGFVALTASLFRRGSLKRKMRGKRSDINLRKMRKDAKGMSRGTRYVAFLKILRNILLAEQLPGRHFMFAKLPPSELLEGLEVRQVV